IWYPGKSRTLNHKAWFKREITLDAPPGKALFFCAADDCFRLYVNDRLVMEGYSWNKLVFRDLAPFFKAGENTVLIKAADSGGAPCGLIYAGIIREKNGREIKICSDSETQASEDNQDWVKAQVLCPFGSAPWGSMSDPQPVDAEYLGTDEFPF
ncbi:MAG: hypothetical protein J5858_00970, partial [Lentisphaeria bacterium]|nr:hypothetical protein [Lentisphaeria bacterium]